MTIGVLFVCTGGVCRGPMAAAVFRKLAQLAGIEQQVDIGVAGTLDGGGERPPSLLAREVASRRGFQIADTPTPVLSTEDLARYDYQLGMDRSHIDAMRWLAPSGRMDRPRLLMQYAASAIDIVDPYGGATPDYERALELIERGCTGLMTEIMRHRRTP